MKHGGVFRGVLWFFIFHILRKIHTISHTIFFSLLYNFFSCFFFFTSPETMWIIVGYYREIHDYFPKSFKHLLSSGRKCELFTSIFKICIYTQPSFLFLYISNCHLHTLAEKKSCILYAMVSNFYAFRVKQIICVDRASTKMSRAPCGDLGILS